MTIALRDYQTEGVAKIRASLRDHRRVLFVLSTGGGKTVIFTFIAESASAKGNDIMIVAHRQEIVEQISSALDAMGVRHGMIMPGRTMTGDRVQVAMVQTIARRLDTIKKPPALLIVDEAHHGVAGQWRKVTEAFPAAKILGVTATPERLDGKGLSDAFDDMVRGPGTKWLIEAGHLAGFDYFAPPSQVDFTAIRTRMGEYALDDLAAAMDRATITGDAVQHYREALAGRPAIAFCVTVEHAVHVAEQFRSAGIAAASVDGSMDKALRRDRIRALADGRLHVLTSCDLISEGVDVPVCAGAILLRPTKSLGMHLQQIGRVLRRKPDGSRAVILDHVGNVSRHGLPDADRNWSLAGRKKKESAPGVRTCRLCYAVVPAGPVGLFRCSGDLEEGDSCPILAPDPAAKAPPTVVDGKLEKFVDPATWARGVDLKNGSYYQLLELADTEDKLRQVAKARGYHHGWVKRVLRARAERQVAA